MYKLKIHKSQYLTDPVLTGQGQEKSLCPYKRPWIPSLSILFFDPPISLWGKLGSSPVIHNEYNAPVLEMEYKVLKVSLSFGFVLPFMRMNSQYVDEVGTFHRLILLLDKHKLQNDSPTAQNPESLSELLYHTCWSIHDGMSKKYQKSLSWKKNPIVWCWEAHGIPRH